LLAIALASRAIEQHGIALNRARAGCTSTKLFPPQPTFTAALRSGRSSKSKYRTAPDTRLSLAWSVKSPRLDDQPLRPEILLFATFYPAVLVATLGYDVPADIRQLDLNGTNPQFLYF
jgi:hypothetical protein